jgi:hypothetical protein
VERGVATARSRHWQGAGLPDDERYSGYGTSLIRARSVKVARQFEEVASAAWSRVCKGVARCRHGSTHGRDRGTRRILCGAASQGRALVCGFTLASKGAFNEKKSMSMAQGGFRKLRRVAHHLQARGNIQAQEYGKVQGPRS